MSDSELIVSPEPGDCAMVPSGTGGEDLTVPMAFCGGDDHERFERLHSIGKVALGITKRHSKTGNLYPEEVDYFVFTNPEVQPLNDRVSHKMRVDTYKVLIDYYGPRPKQLEILVPPGYGTNAWFPRIYRWWGMSKYKGKEIPKLKCYNSHPTGDMALRRNEKSQMSEPHNCLHQECPNFGGRNGCKVQASLYLYVWPIASGVFQIDTGSYHSITTLVSQFNALRKQFGRLDLLDPKDNRPMLVLERLPKATYIGAPALHWTMHVKTRRDLTVFELQNMNILPKAHYKELPLDQAIPLEQMPEGSREGLKAAGKLPHGDLTTMSEAGLTPENKDNGNAQQNIPQGGEIAPSQDELQEAHAILTAYWGADVAKDRLDKSMEDGNLSELLQKLRDYQNEHPLKEQPTTLDVEATTVSHVQEPDPEVEPEVEQEPEVETGPEPELETEAPDSEERVNYLSEILPKAFPAMDQSVLDGMLEGAINSDTVEDMIRKLEIQMGVTTTPSPAPPAEIAGGGQDNPLAMVEEKDLEEVRRKETKPPGKKKSKKKASKKKASKKTAKNTEVELPPTPPVNRLKESLSEERLTDDLL